MKWAKEERGERLEQFAQAIFNVETADEGIAALEAWFKKIAAPITLAELDIDKKEVDTIAENAYLTSERWHMSEQYSKDAIADVLAFA